MDCKELIIEMHKKGCTPEYIQYQLLKDGYDLVSLAYIKSVIEEHDFTMFYVINNIL